MKIFKLHRHQKGFTIVELMIATLVFSLTLLVITYGVLHFTSDYYKGVNSSTTQNTARSIMDTVTQSVQFSGSDIITTQGSPGGLQYFCAGNQIFIYILGVQYQGLAPSASNPGLFEYPTTICDPTALPTGFYTDGSGKELLANHMRLAVLSLGSSANLQTYNVSIRLAYSSGGSSDGDDLLCSPSLGSGTGGCARGTANPTSFALSDLTCRLQTGFQFCAISALQSTVVQRVSSSELTT